MPATYFVFTLIEPQFEAQQSSQISKIAFIYNVFLLVGAPPTTDISYIDKIGVKGGGQTYTYQVCETGSGNCAGATAGF